MKTHYQLLGVDPTADAETIKKAFRREIARYHPDKVTHLGHEFQEMASTRAAELTAAYKTLSDPTSRAEYDEWLQGGDTSAPAAPPAAPGGATTAKADSGGAATAVAEAPADSEGTPRPEAKGRRFAAERERRDDIVRRAVLNRVRDVLQQVLGECDHPSLRGFDLACLPRTRPMTSRSLSELFRRAVQPVVLVRIVPRVDGAQATDAWSQALRLKLDTKGQPTVLLLIGNELAPSSELAKAVEDARRKSPPTQGAIIPVPVDIRDWSARIPTNAPSEVRHMVNRLKSVV